MLHGQRGEPAEALDAYDALAALGSADAAVHQARGDCLQALGRFREAVQAYEDALAREPGRVETLNNRGAALETLGDADAALASFDAALLARPDHAGALYNRGGVLLAMGRLAEAVESYDRALALQPGFATALNNRALALAALGRPADAVADYDAALAAADYAEAWNNRSAALRAMGRLDEALDSASRAIALRPAFPQAFNSRGLAAAALNRFEAALDDYAQALAIRPDDRDVLNNAGVALTALGRFEAAQAHHLAALAIDPGFAEASFNLALLALRRGDFAQGWRLHEARWRRAGQPGPTFPDDRLWLGEGDVNGAAILLHAEQGLGDTIQFARFAQAVRDRGARVVLQVQPPLVRLMRRLRGADQVVGVGEPPPPVDRHIPLMSLPLVKGAAMQSDAYLTAAADWRARWRARLPDEGLKVGLVWSGNPSHGNDRNRSIPLQALAPLFELGGKVRFVTLQPDLRASDRAIVGGLPILDLGADLQDFADAAGLVAALDLVISVDTSVVHLAGALGRPVWVLLPRFADWRWMEDRDDSPWYASARLFRQRRFGDWAEVVGRVRAALAERAGDTGEA